jgi:GTPase KRas protein
VGQGGVGKTALCLRFQSDYFDEWYDPYFEDSFRKQVTVDLLPTVVDLMEIPGHDEYTALTDQYIRSSEVILLAYSITSRQSFEEALGRWVSRNFLSAKDQRV